MKEWEKRQLILDCFLACLPVRAETLEEFRRVWMLEKDEIEALDISGIPSVVHNMIVAASVQRQIGSAGGISEFFYTGNLWLLDVPSRFRDTGIILPVRDASGRSIKHLQVYRYPKDARPFIVGKH